MCGFERLRFSRRVILFVAHCFAESLDCFTDVGTQARQFFGAEHQQYHDQNYDPVLPAKNALYEFFQVYLLISAAPIRSVEGDGIRLRL